MPHTDPRGIAYEVCVAQDFAPDGTDLIAVTEAVIAEHIAEHDAVRDEVIAELARKHENSEAHVEVLMNVNQAFATKCDEHKAERDHAIEGFTPGDVERLQMKARAAIAVADAHDRLDRQAWADEHDGRHVPDQDFENLQAKYEALEAKYIALLRQTLTMKRAKARRKLRTA
jgi:vacuolar-type H+-ATPase subunit I/STV1